MLLPNKQLGKVLFVLEGGILPLKAILCNDSEQGYIPPVFESSPVTYVLYDLE